MRSFKLFLFSFFVVFSCISNDYKIYDCFTFFNELDVLEIRLNELYDKVDKFVLVESTKTFNGKNKPLYFEKNRERFKKYSDKIVYLKFIPDKNKISKEEFYKSQTNYLMTALKDAKDNDIILISDVDEIFSERKFDQFTNLINEHNHNLVRGEIRNFEFFLNRWDPNKPFIDKLIAVKYSYLKNSTPFEIKEKTYIQAPLVRDSGWHFSSMGWLDKVTEKQKVFDRTVLTNSKKINARNLLREARSKIYCFIDEEYPKFVTDNKEYFTQINFIDDECSNSRRFIKLLNKRDKNNKSIKLIKSNSK